MLPRITSRSYMRLSSKVAPWPIVAQASLRNLSSSSNVRAAKVLFDQTKKDNDPNGENTDEQVQNAKPAPAEKKGSGKHSAKEAEPEAPTSRSTGIKSEGQTNQAGEGENKNVHKETRGEPGPNMTWGGKK